ncbi:nuclear transport factor 2 family protein [Roseospira marina]|uniref:Nuclear transport factor 2 family protein n=1 Tax=Roseospira marina TaxID=140057 RepID=A0A5M6IDP4_9PROT|nr:nuclear transport factor 2 family protein [Roseospira marina]KAA5606087.1 nuclear transport factor 2 family protein [Roseospira marina]MBB4313047.1 steroid delta-isomerase [Roseospira marina]MBB5086212.1 steroid delta-isomerase [Roseospira marina]
MTGERTAPTLDAPTLDAPEPTSAVLAGAARYVAFFEALTPEALDTLGGVVTEDVHFVDPFNDTVGQDALRRVFLRMYADTQDPCFRVTHRAFDGSVCFLRWVFTARVRRLGAVWRIEGVSELRFAPDGRVCEHVDHWDAGRQFYERLPGLGWLLRRVRRRLGHNEPDAVSRS